MVMAQLVIKCILFWLITNSEVLCCFQCPLVRMSPRLFPPSPPPGEVPAWSLVPDVTSSLRQAGLLLPPPSPPLGQNCTSQGGQGGSHKVQVQVSNWDKIWSG